MVLPLDDDHGEEGLHDEHQNKVCVGAECHSQHPEEYWQLVGLTCPDKVLDGLTFHLCCRLLPRWPSGVHFVFLFFPGGHVDTQSLDYMVSTEYRLGHSIVNWKRLISQLGSHKV